MTIYEVWCEWDFGQVCNKFATYKLAREWIEEQLAESGAGTFEELRVQGLVGIEVYDVIGSAE